MIFVTGGTGFLGRHLIPALCREGHRIRVLTRYPRENQWLLTYPNVEIVSGDLADRAVLVESTKGCRHIVHAGGHFRFWGDEKTFMEINARGTENMLYAATEAQVERFIHISSVAVIGQPDPTNVIDESYPPRPVEPYQRSKYEGEQLALQHWKTYGLPVTILRPGAFYGPLGEYAFNRLFFRDPMRGIIMQLDGGRYINFPVYIADVPQGIINALAKARIGEIYHICGDWISHKDAFDIVCEEANIRWPRIRIPGWMGIKASQVLEMVANITGREPFWPINMRSYVYNNWRISSEKARCELDFTPTPFREGARRTIAWYKAGRPQAIPEIDC